MRTLKVASLVLGGAAVVFVPLYAATRARAVTHPEWAGMLVRALDMEGGLREDAPPAEVFAALSWKGSLNFPADRYRSASGIALRTEGGAQSAVATEAEGELAYPLSVITGGDYSVRARLGGDSRVPAVTEIVAAGETAPTGTVTLSPPAVPGWVDGGRVHLDRGVYSAVVRLPAGATLQALEVAPPCVAAVEPLRGWSERAEADTVDVAVTVVKAIDAESELPPAAAPIETAAFRDEAAGPGPRRAVAFLELPEAGLYTVAAYGSVGGGQGWSADTCRKSILCAPAGPAASGGPQWLTLMTAPFTAGRHVFTVTLVGDALVERLRAEKKKDAGPDYVATLRRLGFDVGETGPVSRARAEEAMAFVEQRAAALTPSRCGDIALPDSALRVAGFQPASIAGPAVPGAATGIGPGPIGNPAVPLDFAGPSPSPVPTPSAAPSAPPASPPPTPAPVPTPSPIPTQPPGSGVTPTPAP